MNQVKGQWTHDYLDLWHLHTVNLMCIVLHACLPGMDFPTGGQFPELATSPYLVIFGAEKRMPLTHPPLCIS